VLIPDQVFPDHSNKICNKFLTQISRAGKINTFDKLTEVCRNALRDIYEKGADGKNCVILGDVDGRLVFKNAENSVEFNIFYYAAYLKEDKLFKKVLKYSQYLLKFRWFSYLLSFTTELKIRLLYKSNDTCPTPAQQAYIYLSCMSPVDGTYPSFNINEAENLAADFPLMSIIDDTSMREFSEKNCALSIIEKYIGQYIDMHNKIVSEITQNSNKVIFTHHTESTSFISLLDNGNFKWGRDKFEQLVNPFGKDRTVFGLSQNEIEESIVNDELIRFIKANIENRKGNEKKVAENNQKEALLDLIHISLISYTETKLFGESTNSALWYTASSEREFTGKDLEKLGNKYINFIMEKIM